MKFLLKIWLIFLLKLKENENALSDDYISVELIEMQGKSKL